MAALGTHSVVAVRAGASLPPKLAADVIVSHVVLSWRNLPFVVALRSRYARIPLVHMEHSYSPAFFRDEVSVPFPHLEVTIDGERTFADAAGRFPYTGGRIDAALDGRHLRTECNGCVNPAQPGVTAPFGAGTPVTSY